MRTEREYYQTKPWQTRRLRPITVQDVRGQEGSGYGERDLDDVDDGTAVQHFVGESM